MTRTNISIWIGCAALVCVALISGPAYAASPCATITPSYTYTPVAAGGGYGSVGISTPAGCPWHVQAHVGWVSITSAAQGYGPATVSFYVAPNPNKAVRRGTFGMPAVVNQAIGTRSGVDNVVTSGFTVTLDEYGR